MYYTTSGAYRKSKMIIDYINIGLTVLIGIMFILILFLRGQSGLLFPGIFFAGALMNALTSVKCFMTKHPIRGLAIAVVTLLLLVMALFSLYVVAG